LREIQKILYSTEVRLPLAPPSMAPQSRGGSPRVRTNTNAGRLRGPRGRGAGGRGGDVLDSRIHIGSSLTACSIINFTVRTRIPSDLVFCLHSLCPPSSHRRYLIPSRPDSIALHSHIATYSRPLPAVHKECHGAVKFNRTDSQLEGLVSQRCIESIAENCTAPRERIQAGTAPVACGVHLQLIVVL
jgi:hypothetical protein